MEHTGQRRLFEKAISFLVAFPAGPKAPIHQLCHGTGDHILAGTGLHQFPFLLQAKEDSLQLVASFTFRADVLDGAGWHRGDDLLVPPNLTLLKLPPYAPELNSAENVWEYLRKNKLAQRLYADYRAWYPGLSTVLVVQTTAELDAAMPEATVPENPLKFAAARAMANANGSPICLGPVSNPDDIAAWAATLGASVVALLSVSLLVAYVLHLVVEKPMLEVVLAKAGTNQTLAAEMLGINRNTLRKKLTEHQLL